MREGFDEMRYHFRGLDKQIAIQGNTLSYIKKDFTKVKKFVGYTEIEENPSSDELDSQLDFPAVKSNPPKRKQTEVQSYQENASLSEQQNPLGSIQLKTIAQNASPQPS